MGLLELSHSGPSVGFFDQRYLKLDASNDPITGVLDFSKNTPSNTSNIEFSNTHPGGRADIVWDDDLSRPVAKISAHSSDDPASDQTHWQIYTSKGDRATWINRFDIQSQTDTPVAQFNNVSRLQVISTGSAVASRLYLARQAVDGTADITNMMAFEKRSTSGSQLQDVASTGNALFDLDPIPQDGTSSAQFRFFRNTSTTGTRSISVYVGDGTSTLQHIINANGNSYFQATTGNFGIGTASPGTKLDVNSTGNVINMGGTNVSTYLTAAGARSFFGYDGSNSVVQGGLGKGIKFNVNNSTFGSGTVMSIDTAGDALMTGYLWNQERISVGPGITVVNPSFTIEANEVFTDTSGEKRGLSFFVGSNPGSLSSTSLLGFNGFVEHQSTSNVTGALFGGFAGSRLASTATASVMYGGFWEVQSTSTGTVSFAVGNVGSINESGGGTIGFSYGLQSTATVAGSIGTFYGVQVSNPSGAGTMSTNYGIHIDSQTKGATNQAIYLEGTGSTNAVEWQGDTRLYRGFAGGVYTDGSFVLPQDNGYVYMGASFDFGLTHDGTNCVIDAFTGNLELDSSSGNVVSQSDFQVAKRVIKSKSVYTGTDTTDDVSIHVCNSATTFTLTVTDGTQDGETIKIINRGAGAVTLSGNISTVTATTTLIQGESLELVWDTTNGEWE